MRRSRGVHPGFLAVVPGQLCAGSPRVNSGGAGWSDELQSSRRGTSELSCCIPTARCNNASMAMLVRRAQGLDLHLSSTNATGYTGVSRRAGKQTNQFEARLGNPTRAFIGSFPTAVEAGVAYARARKAPRTDQGSAQPIGDGIGEAVVGVHDGSEHIGKRVTRLFWEGGGPPMRISGVVISRASPSGSAEALYRVRHDDGDSEDLDEQELLDGLAMAADRPITLEGRFLAVPTSFFQVEAGRYLARVSRVTAGGCAWLEYGDAFPGYSHWVPRSLAMEWLLSCSEARAHRSDWVDSGGVESFPTALALTGNGAPRPAERGGTGAGTQEAAQASAVPAQPLPAGQEAAADPPAKRRRFVSPCPAQFRVSEAVLGRFGPVDDEGKACGVLDRWYRAVVRDVNVDGTYALEYEDGDFCKKVPSVHVRARKRPRKGEASSSKDNQQGAPPPQQGGPPPAPNPVGGQPPGGPQQGEPPPVLLGAPGMPAVEQALRSVGLQQYAGAFDEEGYDDLGYILSLNAAERATLAETVAMLPGHALKFCRWGLRRSAPPTPASS